MTKELDIKIPSFWKNRNGDKVCVYDCNADFYDCIIVGGDELYRCDPNGKAVYKPMIHSGDLIEPWTEPRTGEFWVNVYDTHATINYSSKENADELAASDRLACVKVTWTEGQGLEGVE